MAAKYMIQQVEKVVAEAEFLKDLIQSAFIPQLMGVYESPLQCILVTEFLAGGDLVTRTAQDSYRLTERKCQIFLRQVGWTSLSVSMQHLILNTLLLLRL